MDKLKEYLVLIDKIIIVECVSLIRNNTEQERELQKYCYISMVYRK